MKKTTVEACQKFDLVELNKSAIFSLPEKTILKLTWDGSNNEPDRYVELEVLHNAAINDLAGPRRPSWIKLRVFPGPVEQLFRLERVACLNGGDRYWLRCFTKRDGKICYNRVRVLYRPPSSSIFGCRRCMNLTYSSAQTHDKRVDAMIRNPELLTKALDHPNLNCKLLGVAALTKMIQKINRNY